MASADVTSTCSTMPEGEADISGLNHQQEEREAPDTAVFTPNASAHSDLIVLTFQYSSYKNERKKSCSVVSNSLQPHGLVAYQGPLSMRFSRQEYWSGLPFPSPGDPYTLRIGIRHGKGLGWSTELERALLSDDRGP